MLCFMSLLRKVSVKRTKRNMALSLHQACVRCVFQSQVFFECAVSLARIWDTSYTLFSHQHNFQHINGQMLTVFR